MLKAASAFAVVTSLATGEPVVEESSPVNARMVRLLKKDMIADGEIRKSTVSTEEHSTRSAKAFSTLYDRSGVGSAASGKARRSVCAWPYRIATCSDERGSAAGEYDATILEPATICRANTWSCA